MFYKKAENSKILKFGIICGSQCGKETKIHPHLKKKFLEINACRNSKRFDFEMHSYFLREIDFKVTKKIL